MSLEIQYVSEQEFAATVAAAEARVQANRLKRFAGKRERTFTVTVVEVSPYQSEAGYGFVRTRQIKGFTLADAKEQAGIR